MIVILSEAKNLPGYSNTVGLTTNAEQILHYVQDDSADGRFLSF